MRQMSFALTKPQFIDGSKTVTRRTGWSFLKAGDIVMAVEKGRGLKKGEKVVQLGAFEVVSVRAEPLKDITKEDCILEGFPEMEPIEFVIMFLRANKGCSPETIINRIEFRKV